VGADNILPFTHISKDVWEVTDRYNTFTIWRSAIKEYWLTKRGERGNRIFRTMYKTLALAKEAALERRYEWIP